MTVFGWIWGPWPPRGFHAARSLQHLHIPRCPPANRLTDQCATGWTGVAEYRTYWLCMSQRVRMKPFLDHLNCNTDELERVTKQQWDVSVRGLTNNYWFLHIICLVSLSEAAHGPHNPTRLICPNTSLWITRTSARTHVLILTSDQKFFGNFSFSTVLTPSREPTYLLCPDTALKSLTVRGREGERRRELWHVNGWENMQTAINKLVLTSSQQHTGWEDL